MKILIISDLHIRNNVRHDEYLLYFQYIEEQIFKYKPDYILFCGDLFHSKTTLSPDSFTYAYKFLKMLTICPNTQVVVMAGNHDMNEKNLDKLDAITPLFEHLDSERYYYCKTSNDIFFEDVAFRPYPLSDKGNWRFDRNGISDSEILIGIYHGPLNGVKTDLGFVFSEGRDVKEFENCDYLFCGDIHSLTDYTESGSKISVGNPIQQDFGEHTKKGMWLYEIESRTQFQRRFIEIPNYFPYITLNAGESIPYLAAAQKVRFRIFSNLSHEDTQEYVKKVKTIFGQRIQSLTISRTPIDNIENSISKIMTYNEYIQDKDNKDKLLELYNFYIKEVEDISNVNNWKIKQITWNNLLSYEENNFIDFEQLEGKAIGIFGKNYSGKTSVIDIICFALYGSWTKPFVKLINLINDRKKYADVTLILQINDKEYTIYRHLERVGKTCKSTLTFKNVTDNLELNEVDIGSTQKSIESYIGSKSQFLLTSLSTQFNNFSLLDEKNTKRKEYFSSFLGITKYEQIYKLVKDDIKTLKDEISVYSKFSNLEEISKKINLTELDINEAKVELENLDRCIQKFYTVDKTYYKTIIKNKELRNNTKFMEQQLSLKLEKNNKKIDALSKEIMPDIYCPQIPVPEEASEDIHILLNTVDLLSAQIMKKNFELEKCQEAKKLLNSVPCGTQYLQCRFITTSKAFIEIDDIALVEEIKVLQSELTETKAKIKTIEQQNDLIKKNIAKNKEFEKIIQKNDLIKRQINDLVKEREEDVKEYNNLYKELKRLDDIVEQDASKEKEIEIMIKEELDTHKLRVAFEGRLKVLEIQKKELQNTLDIISSKQLSLAYLEEFSETVGKNGIIVSILNQYIPAIADFVNNILINFVEFKISIDIENDKDIEIYIEDSFSSRLVETCSGSQMTIIAYALRMALLHYCQIPSCNLVIMDEPATSLDSDHLADFSKLLDMLKLHNKTIMMVTHIMMLKDFMEVSLLVDKSSGYSKIIS